MKKSVLLLAAVMIFNLVIFNCATASEFKDVAPSHWAYREVKAMAEKGFISGYPDGTFRGGRKLSRYVLAKIVARLVAYIDQAKKSGKTISGEDVDMIGKLSEEFATELGVLSGKMMIMEERLKVMEEKMSKMEKEGVANKKGLNSSIKLKLDGKLKLDYNYAKKDDDTTFSDFQKQYIYARFGLHGEVNDVVSFYTRFVGAELRSWANYPNDTSVTMDRFHVLFKDRPNLGDVKIGRQLIRFGKGTVLATDTYTGIHTTLEKSTGDLQTIFLEDNNNLSGFEIKGLTYDWKKGNNKFNLYYLTKKESPVNTPTWMSLSGDGKIDKDTTYYYEYVNFEQDKDSAQKAVAYKSSSILVGFKRRILKNLHMRIQYAQQGELFNVLRLDENEENMTLLENATIASNTLITPKASSSHWSEGTSNVDTYGMSYAPSSALSYSPGLTSATDPSKDGSIRGYKDLHISFAWEPVAGKGEDKLNNFLLFLKIDSLTANDDEDGIGPGDTASTGALSSDEATPYNVYTLESSYKWTKDTYLNMQYRMLKWGDNDGNAAVSNNLKDAEAFTLGVSVTF